MSNKIQKQEKTCESCLRLLLGGDYYTLDVKEAFLPIYLF